ncbi:triphosphoribosyl-dephospho-CoA synthase MdcB [Bradyrhizobium daqingense]|uniref:Probable 2-(5''-triphosphoribosyl)-3'-dephosphocoenzyme-A synthase n=1 Tax=Bradyrhizobium daqingense TaxID=993502 RepID=A0A562KR66_9BRAD|nr:MULTISPECIES: triphosphoribosyl-dephospho-CoA synthase MdcB [Bradyrhizobium]MDQ8731689.1 triphosphoribosyl-dephospho-CoA synthase MdcB [Bradyrhizobium sp. LHD-71]TWH97911.1 triphosphoribosyl-dephospho-CoA synthase [Bradyrhizobium daqingense]UFS91585.1 triphosphoribosyl-dephospho-CoA synthase MdcB [Bradyrhizobium daqingense]
MITAALRGAEPLAPRRARPAPDVSAIGDLAADCLVMELETWPKPGLVSHVDKGSHDDMDAGTFRRSAEAIKPYLQSLAEAGARGCGMGRLRIIGLDAERAMFAATDGVNTHRGAIFGLGLLCAAAGARAGGLADPVLPLGDVVARRWGAGIIDGPLLLHSHGRAVRRRFHAGGASLEAASGFPSIYRIGLPALRRAMSAVPGDAEAARVEACFALIASVEDTNLLHRGGLDGLRFAHRAARQFIEAGGVRAAGWRERARSIHDSFVARRLSPGGSADLLAMSLFVGAEEGAER